MKIPANSLKELSRKLRGIGGELFNFDGKLAYSKVDNLDVVVDFPLECAAPFAVSAEKFSQIAARLDSEVDFTTTESKLVLKTKKSKLTLPITEARPAIKILQQNSLITVQQDSLIIALNFALQASVRSLTHSYSGAVFVIPAPAAEALKIFHTPQLDIGQDEQNMYFIGGDTKLIARRYVKSFPLFEKLIPESNKFNFEFNRDEVLNGLKSLAPLTEEKSKIFLTIGDSSVILSLTSQQGEGSIEIPASGGDTFIPFECSLSFEFVQDFVESVRGPAVFLRCNSEKGSFLLESGKFKLIIAGSR